MVDLDRSDRAVPVPFWIALALGALCALGRASAMHHWFERLASLERTSLLLTGASIATTAMLGAGVWELSKRTRGLIATGLRVATWSIVAVLVLNVTEQAASELLDYSGSKDGIMAAYEVADRVRLVLYAIQVCALAAAAVAGCRRRPDLVAIAVGLTAIRFVWVIPALQPYFRGTYGADLSSRELTGYAMSVAMLASQVVLAVLTLRGSPARTGDRVAVIASLRGLAASIWLRIGAAAGVIAFIALDAGARSYSIVRIAMVGAPALDVLGQAWFVIAALAFARGLGRDEARGRVYTGTTLIILATMVAVFQTVALAGVLFDRVGGWGRPSDASLHALAVVAPVLIVVGMLAIASAAATAVTRTNAHAAAAAVRSRAVAFAALSAVAIALSGYALSGALFPQSVAAVMGLAATANVLAVVVFARACRAAATALSAPDEVIAALPVARLL